jgi:hypothetical protein
MSEIGWNLSGTDKQCSSYGGGHWVHWLQHKLSVREPAPAIPVRAAVDDRGVILVEGDGLSLEMWNHRPALVRAALRRSTGVARWKPHWHLLVVPTGDPVDGAANVFDLVAGGRRHECRIVRTTNLDHLVARTGSPAEAPPPFHQADTWRRRPRPAVSPHE